MLALAWVMRNGTVLTQPRLFGCKQQRLILLKWARNSPLCQKELTEGRTDIPVALGSLQGTSVSGSSHFLPLNLGPEIQIFVLLGVIIWLAYLDHGRIGLCDCTPKQWGGGDFPGGDGDLLQKRGDNGQNSVPGAWLSGPLPPSPLATCSIMSVLVPFFFLC